MKEIKHLNGPSKGVFRLMVDGEERGFMSYAWAGESRFIIDHTIVHPGNQGQGYGKELVAAGVEFARQEGVKIIPLCPFAKAVIEKNPDYRDVL
ncbi:MAG: GNAT family N-acetyltransferase [Porphyromonas sp.]|nr:GNAT family N-acetyltransferase [Porphyromonas sp.]